MLLGFGVGATGRLPPRTVTVHSDLAIIDCHNMYRRFGGDALRLSADSACTRAGNVADKGALRAHQCAPRGWFLRRPKGPLALGRIKRESVIELYNRSEALMFRRST